MIGVEVVKDDDKTPASAEAAEVKKRAREAGMLIGVGGSLANVVRLQPPLIITEAEAAEATDKLKTILKDLDQSL